jgi:hypothetical protein
MIVNNPKNNNAIAAKQSAAPIAKTNQNKGCNLFIKAK